MYVFGKCNTVQSSSHIPVSPRTFGYDFLATEQLRRFEQDRIYDVLSSVRTMSVTAFEQEGWEDGISDSGIDHGQLKKDLVMADLLDPDVDVVADAYEKAREVDVSEVRIFLSRLSDSRRRTIENYVAVNNPKLYDSQDRQAFHASQSWFDWFISSPRKLTNNGADQRIIDVMEWNVAHVHALQNSPEFQEAAESAKVRFRYSLQSEIDQEMHGAHAESAVGQIADTKVYISDPFDNQFTPNVLGYYYSGTDYVTVCPKSWKSPKSVAEALPETLDHEMLHRVSTDGRSDVTFRQEGFVEHFTASHRSGEYDVLNPHDRRGDTQIYVGYRTVSAVLYSEAPRLDSSVGVRLGMRALLGSIEEQNMRDDALDEGWRVEDVQGKVQARIITHTRNVAAARPDLSQSDRLEEACDVVATELRSYASDQSQPLFSGFGLPRI